MHVYYCPRQQSYNNNNYYRELESSVAEHWEVKFAKSPSSEAIKVVQIV